MWIILRKFTSFDAELQGLGAINFAFTAKFIRFRRGLSFYFSAKSPTHRGRVFKSIAAQRILSLLGFLVERAPRRRKNALCGPRLIIIFDFLFLRRYLASSHDHLFYEDR